MLSDVIIDETTSVMGQVVTSENGSATYMLSNVTGSHTITAKFSEAWPGWNEPVIKTGLTPVNWNGSSWVATTKENWDYNYNSVATESQTTVTGNGNGKWANAQTADGSLYVWIPRYTYKIERGYHSLGNSWNSSNGNTETGNKILIKFSNGITDETTEGATNASQGYIAHSAFTFGDDELTGIWVAKYEASQGSTISEVSIPTSSNNVVRSLPGVTPWGGISISKMFEYAYNAYRNADSHLMRNSEWGAVAYLTNAIGRIPYINNYYVDSTIKTGYSGAQQDSAQATSTSSTYAWNTTNGVKASTTHNVYGIYDMSGGSWEYGSAYYTGGNSTYLSGDIKNKSNLGVLYANRSTKYVKQYSAILDTEKTGDALYEISNGTSGSNSWDGDHSYLTEAGNPNYLYGGDYGDSKSSGIFSYSRQIIVKSEFGFRTVLTPESVPDYYVTFNSNGGTGTMTRQGFKTGVAQNLVSNQFEKIGYAFSGWSTTEGGTTVEYENEAEFTANANTTLYAVWEVSGTEFVKTTSTTLVNGAKYIICYDTNALKNNSGSISSSTVSPVNDKIITADETIMWTYSNGKFINDATGTSYYLKSTSSTVSLSSTASQGGGISYLSSSKLKIGSYYLRYNSGFIGTSGTSSASAITLYVEPGFFLDTPTGSATSTTSISVSITGNIIPNGGNINYKLYVDGRREGSSTDESGDKVSFSVTGLSIGTTYRCYVVATSEIDATQTVTSSTISVKTYDCDGTGKVCSPPSEECRTCAGRGVTTTRGWGYNTCPTCGKSFDQVICVCGAMIWPHSDSCGNIAFHGGIDNSVGTVHDLTKCTLCSSCNGAYFNSEWHCRHGYTSSHSVCSHEYSSAHYN